jgi:hypothetical protein
MAWDRIVPHAHCSFWQLGSTNFADLGIPGNLLGHWPLSRTAARSRGRSGLTRPAELSGHSSVVCEVFHERQWGGSQWRAALALSRNRFWTAVLLLTPA